MGRMNATSKMVLMTLPLAHHHFTVEAYDEMVARGILVPDDRAELLAGEIVKKLTIGSRHAAAVRRLNRVFTRSLGDRAVVSAQCPVRLPPDSEPEPDIALLEPRDDLYAFAHPSARDVLLLVEVADSSLDLDRTLKLPLYAAAGIPETWLIDLTSNAIEAYTQPRDGAYSNVRSLRSNDAIAPFAFPDLALRVADLLP